MSDLEARIAESLMAPKTHHQGSPLSYMSKWAADHHSADLAPLIREAQAEAWDESTSKLKSTIGAFVEEGVWAIEQAEKLNANPYRNNDAHTN